MMGRKTAQPELYVSFSLDSAVPRHHVLRKIAAIVDFEFVRSLAASYYSWTGQPSVDPVVIVKLHLLGYLFNIRSERQLSEEAGRLRTLRGYRSLSRDLTLPTTTPFRRLGLIAP